MPLIDQTDHNCYPLIGLHSLHPASNVYIELSEIKQSLDRHYLVL